MIDFNSTSYDFADRLKSLNNKLYSNFNRMENLNSSSTTYRELYEENEKIVKELEGLISGRR